MKMRMTLVLAVIGAGLLAATVIQARSAAGKAATPVRSEAARPRGVAAEGRVAGYPGSEVRIAAERGGRFTRVLVEEGQAVRAGSSWPSSTPTSCAPPSPSRARASPRRRPS